MHSPHELGFISMQLLLTERMADSEFNGVGLAFADERREGF
jgi:hypothetical protein